MNHICKYLYVKERHKRPITYKKLEWRGRFKNPSLSSKKYKRRRNQDPNVVGGIVCTQRKLRTSYRLRIISNNFLRIKRLIKLFSLVRLPCRLPLGRTGSSTVHLELGLCINPTVHRTTSKTPLRSTEWVDRTETLRAVASLSKTGHKRKSFVWRNSR